MVNKFFIIGRKCYAIIMVLILIRQRNLRAIKNLSEVY